MTAPGNKDEDFRHVAAAAATHLGFTQFGTATGSRYGAAIAFYYTRAWFDRYLKGDRSADQRLLATRFDDSGDAHNVSGGEFDPATQKNAPAYLAARGRTVRVHLRGAPARMMAFRLHVELRTHRGPREVSIVRRYRLCRD